MTTIGNSSYEDAMRLQQTRFSTQTGAQEGVNYPEAETTIFDSEMGTENTTTLETAEDDYLAAAEAAGITETEEAANTAAVSGTYDVEETEEAKKIREEIEKLEEEKEENIEKMEKLEKEIEDLAKSAEENIMKAAAAQEAAVKEHEEETQAVLDEQLQAYINANKEGGEGMTRDELQANIKGAMPNTPEIGEAVAALTAASEQVSEIDSCLGELNKLISDTQLIEDEIEAKQGNYDTVMQAAEEAACNPQPCEPQGFQDNEGNQYDFFIDKDGNGDLSNETEFLGYEGGLEGQEAAWSEMTDLDTNLDGVVDAEELSAGGVMVYKTDANGNQQAMTIEEAFGEDSDLAISTTQHDEAKEGVGPNNFNVGEGSENNELWGTFDVTLNGETLNGYQTNDDLEWLKDNYNFTDYAGADAEDAESAIQYSEDLQPHANFFDLYTEKSAELKEEIAGAYENIGVSQEQMESLNEIAKKEADENAKNFFASMGLEDEAKTNEDNNIDNTENATSEEEEEEREEELLQAYAA